MDDIDAGSIEYIDRVIRARCGDEIADAVFPVEVLELMMQVANGLEAQAAKLWTRLSAEQWTGAVDAMEAAEADRAGLWTAS
jgi:hypothetical protein